MALSDYVHMAFDTNGKSCGSSFAFKNGFSPELYKNWIYLHHPRAWKTLKNPTFIKDVIAQINSGSMTIGDIYMEVERTKDGNGCMVFMYTSNHKNKKATYEIFSGMAVSGWADEILVNLRKLGRPESERHDFEWMTTSGTGDDGKPYNQMNKHEKVTFKKIEDITIPPTDYDALWLGITKERLAEFHTFIKRVCDDHGMKDYAEKVCKTKALSHNPGDVFIANVLGGTIKPSKVGGKKKMPLLTRALLSSKK